MTIRFETLTENIKSTRDGSHMAVVEGSSNRTHTPRRHAVRWRTQNVQCRRCDQWVKVATAERAPVWEAGDDGELEEVIVECAGCARVYLPAVEITAIDGEAS